MTLIVGIRCSDGIVMGADGAATLGALGQTTTRQPVRKLTGIDDRIIAGVSGAVGLGQRIKGTIEELWHGNALAGKQSFEAMTVIRDAIGKHILTEIQYSAEAAKLIGQGTAALSAITQTVLAVPIDHELCLFQFGCTGDPEQATDNLPFVSIGSGQTRADPFLAFIRYVFWKDSLPSVSQGIFATVWSLLHAIRTDPGGVAEPIQLMTLTAVGKGKYSIKDFEEAELAEHRVAVEEVERHLSGFFAANSTGEPPQPPSA